MLVVSAAETRLALVHLGADSAVVVAFVGIAATVVIAVAVAFGSGGIGDPSRSVMTWGTLFDGFGLW